MSNLTILNINSNRFTGTLSSNISNHAFEVFDISNNQITGNLDFNLDPKEGLEKMLLHAETNRLSGPVNAKFIDMYRSVDILSGNHISCNTLPNADVVYIDSPFFSECETRPVYFSIFIWLIALGVASVICVINYKRIYKYAFLWIRLYKSCLSDELNQVPFTRAIHLIAVLEKLNKLIFISSLCAITALVAIYSGFEFSENANTDYKVMFEKYNYAFSGLYLKSTSPAVVLFIVYTLMTMMMVYTVYRIFLFDWAVLSNATIFLRPRADSTSATFCIISRYVVVGLYLGISFASNFAYVYGLSKVENVLPLQLGFTIFKTLYQSYGSNLLLVFLRKNAYLTKFESALFHTIINIFSTIINPCLATLVVDANCFRDYVFDRADIDISYSYEYCATIDVTTGSCISTGVISIPSSFTPPFIYGHNCRDAVFGNYIPLILLSCAFNTFVYPFLYILLTSTIKSFNDPVTLFIFSLDSKILIFEDSLVSLIEGIIFDLVLMILFGIVYPLCFLFLVIDVTSKIYLLIRRLQLYIEVYQRTINKNTELDKENSEYLENIVSDAVLIAPYLIWPCLGSASVIFGFYLFDMAWDTNTKDLGDLSAPIAFLVLTITSFSAICFVCFLVTVKTTSDLANRKQSLEDSNAVTISNFNLNRVEGKQNLDGVEMKISVNPIMFTNRQ